MYCFAAATINEPILLGASRPGYSDAEVAAWIEFMEQQGIQRVCCLLSESQIAPYSGLIAAYENAFGSDRILWSPIEDFCLCDRPTLTEKILPFLREANSRQEPVVVHCAGGIGRTGHVLAAGLVALRGMTNREAIAAVRRTGRNPYEGAIAAPLLSRKPIRFIQELNGLLDACR